MDHLPLRPRVARELHRLGPDLVHVATPGSMGLNGLAARRWLGVPLVGSYHAACHERVRHRAEQALRRAGLPARGAGRLLDAQTWRSVTWFFDHLEKVVVPSEHVRCEVARRVRAPVGLLARGIDVGTFNPRFRVEPRG